jgi:hypothetical protein
MAWCVLMVHAWLKDTPVLEINFNPCSLRIAEYGRLHELLHLRH